MTTRRAFRSQWTREPEPRPEPKDSRLERAKKLPRFGPGIVINIPLSLLPEYLALYQLQPAGIREPKVPRRDGPGEAILLVKRIPTHAPARSAGEEKADEQKKRGDQ